MTPNQVTEKRSGEGRVELVGENALTVEEAEQLLRDLRSITHEPKLCLVCESRANAKAKLRTALKESS